MVQIGMRGTAETSVGPENTAKAMGSGSLDVFATPALIALMEAAACDCVEGSLEPGTTSVGTRMDVSHLAATPVGMWVRAESTLEEIDGRKLVFSVCAYDDAGKIGEGTHERVTVQAERFAAKAKAKLAFAEDAGKKTERERAD